MTDSTELNLIKKTVADIAGDYDDDYWRDITDGNETIDDWWQDCADAGLLGAIVPEEFGGQDMGILELATIVEEFQANGCFAIEMPTIVTVVFGAETIKKNGTQAQKEEYLPGIANGDVRFCMGLTEPDAGHNAPELDTMAEPNGDGYVVNGKKTWISGVDNADGMLLVARTTPKDERESRTHGLSLFLIDPDTAGIELTELDTGIPTPERQFEVYFDDVDIPESALVGEQDEGLQLLFDTVNPERICVSAGCIGTARDALERAVAYAKDREVFEAPIGSHQAIQHPIAEAFSKVQSSKLLVREAAKQVDAGNDAGTLANMAKLRASESSYEATDLAVQVHGGNGLSREYRVVDLWQFNRLQRIAPGSNEMLRNHIAMHELGLPRSY